MLFVRLTFFPTFKKNNEQLIYRQKLLQFMKNERSILHTDNLNFLNSQIFLRGKSPEPRFHSALLTLPIVKKLNLKV